MIGKLTRTDVTEKSGAMLAASATLANRRGSTRDVSAKSVTAASRKRAVTRKSNGYW